MFAPTKIWRKWHVKVNQGQKYVISKLPKRERVVANICPGVSLLPLPLLPPLPLLS